MVEHSPKILASEEKATTTTCDFAHTINDTLKWLTQLPALMQSHSGGDGVVSKW